jgi:hypothetical protein
MTDEQLSNVDRASLEPIARAATGCPDLQVATWQAARLSKQGRRSIFRFVGTGHDRGLPRSWSLILKEIRAPESPDAHDTHMSDWAYWPRETLLYAAGVPQTLTGDLRAPACYGIAQPEPDLDWIWLEDLQDVYGRIWPRERYIVAARHLGAFNGAYLVGTPLPTAPWLVSTGLRTRSATALADVGRLRNPALWTHPRLRRAFPRPVLDAFERLITDRERFLAVAERLPQTFCHFDAWQGNMAAVNDGTGTDVTVLFDWALACYGPVGQELANLVWSTFLEFRVDIAEFTEFETAAFESYLQGLQAAGWQPDPRLVRCAYLIGSVLLFGLVPEAVDHALNEDEHPALERYYGWPIDRMIEQAAEVTYLLFARVDELRALLEDVPDL